MEWHESFYVESYDLKPGDVVLDMGVLMAVSTPVYIMEEHPYQICKMILTIPQMKDESFG